ncbi:hypothetical protein, partial [Porphyromonas uenonis]
YHLSNTFPTVYFFQEEDTFFRKRTAVHQMPKLSNGGKESFLPWKTSFPPLEISFSKAGKFLETC